MNRETGKRGEPRLQFTAFQQLQDTLTAYTRKLTLKFDLDQLDQELLTYLEKLFKKHKGEHKVDITFYESAQKIKLPTSSRKIKVHVGEEFLNALDDYPIAYKLN
jgi:DNA polymerase-3 subunit alpha